ncbi:MAG: carotenoid oxygenase family protein [Gammaproteobacteria bacterium]|nr:carotenoid oxygenase family protein [Gammaproteobacteria bacterium]
MTNFDLNQGALAPLSSEFDIASFKVTGEIPIELNGVLLRNGPNPMGGRFEGQDILSWWPEAAMFHGMYFEDGKVVRYQNRWARTRQWGVYHSTDNVSLMLDTNPNVNFIHHAGELLALGEGARPLSINADLDSLGESRLNGIKNGVSAHPKKDSVTGELVTFRTDWNQPWLSYGVTGPNGDELFSTEIEIPSPMMMHDIAITKTHSVLFDLGVAFDFDMLQQGFSIPLRWHEERQSRIGVIPRFGGDVQWLQIKPCFIQHISNAYNANEHTVIVDAVRYPWYLRTNLDQKVFDANPLGVLWRYTINLKTEEVTEAGIDDLGIELPRINESLIGLPYSYLYAAEQPTNEEIRGVVKYNLNTGNIQRFLVPAGDQNGEPIFVAKKDPSSEDDGWLLIYVYRRDTDSSDLVILDTNDIEHEPQATIHLPHRVPAGFHASWIPLA